MAIKKHTPIGAKFNRLTILGDAPKKWNHHARVFASCECGVVKDYVRSHVIYGGIKSCGCLKNETKSNFRHGRHGTKAYYAYFSMRDRCTNPNIKEFKQYGARGIKVCERWLSSVENFLDDMGPRPTGMSLDRIDVNGNYEPGNCRWATSDQQANNKQDTAYLEFDGRKMSASQWARETGIPRGCIEIRIRKLGWSVERALTTLSKPGRNQFGDGLHVEFNGKSQTFHQWADELGIQYSTLKKRESYGWPIERILTEPLERHSKRC